MTTTERTPLLVLGLGNVLCGDDGAGVAALYRLLDQYEMPDGVHAADGGTLGLSLLPLLDSADAVILVDAIAADGPPGTLVRLEGDEVGPAVYERLSPHQIGVSDLLAGAALVGRYPTRVVLCGIVPATTDLALGRTAAVAAAIDELVAAVAAEMTTLGFAPVPRSTADRDRPERRDDVTRALEL